MIPTGMSLISKATLSEFTAKTEQSTQPTVMTLGVIKSLPTTTAELPFGFRFQLALREHILVDIGMFKVHVVDISMFFREAEE